MFELVQHNGRICDPRQPGRPTGQRHVDLVTLRQAGNAVQFSRRPEYRVRGRTQREHASADATSTAERVAGTATRQVNRPGRPPPPADGCKLIDIVPAESDPHRLPPGDQPILLGSDGMQEVCAIHGSHAAAPGTRHTIPVDNPVDNTSRGLW
ncbi:hypothetical protein ACLQ24_12270 [Micromonospora sp. DT4]|uniref:hypothetical protein n=1 Tax=Micromonospora sp. DT4 TaxID=3393438 RepID=UPI003CEEB001